MTESLGRLLVVDDNEMNRDMLSRRLQRRGYDVMTASGGQQALELVEQGDYDLILLDIMMPDVSGWDVLERIRKDRSRLELPVIMATAKDQSEDVIRALMNGANDYVTKPLDLDIVLARVGTHVILKRTHQKLVDANRKLNNDLAAARRVQQTQLPEKSPDLQGCKIAWYYRPCDDLGGDFLNVFNLGTEQIGLYLLDVSGHGVPAALMSVAVSRALAPSTTDTCIVSKPGRSGKLQDMKVASPADVADKLNRRFPMDHETNQYFTLVYGILERRSRIFRFTSAGHPPLIHAPQRGTPYALTNLGDPPIGMFDVEDGIFGPYQEHRLDLQLGDRLYFYSDGVTEADDEQGQLYGMAKLLHKVAATAEMSLEEAVSALSESVNSWCGPGHHPKDDVSILALQVSD